MRLDDLADPNEPFLRHFQALLCQGNLLWTIDWGRMAHESDSENEEGDPENFLERIQKFHRDEVKPMTSMTARIRVVDYADWSSITRLVEAELFVIVLDDWGRLRLNRRDMEAFEERCAKRKDLAGGLATRQCLRRSPSVVVVPAARTFTVEKLDLGV